MATLREILAGRAAVELTVRDKLKAGLDGAQARLRRFAVSVAALGVSFQSLGALVSRSFAAIESVFTGPADKLQNMADRTGLTVEMLQALAESGADSGATLEDVGGAARAMANFLQQVERESDGALESLDELGISASSLKNATPDERLRIFADALSRIADPTRRAALAQDVFGRGATQLLPVLASGSGAIDEYRRTLEEAGMLRTADQVAAADELGDAFGRLQRRLSGVGFTALASLAPQLQRIADTAVAMVEAFNSFLGTHPELAKAFGVILTGALAAAVGIAALTAAVLVTGAIVAAIGAIVASPFAIAVGAVAALSLALIGGAGIWLLYSESAQEAATSVGMLVTAQATIAKAFVIAMQGILSVFTGQIDAMIALWNMLAEHIGAEPIEFRATGLLDASANILKTAINVGADEARSELDRLAKDADERRAKLRDQLRLAPLGGEGDGDDDRKKGGDGAAARDAELAVGTFSAALAQRFGPQGVAEVVFNPPKEELMDVMPALLDKTDDMVDFLKSIDEKFNLGIVAVGR